MLGPIRNADKQKLFILGVGAQRAGTTWVHEQLKRCAGVDMGFTKEYHVFCNRKKSLRGQWRRHRRRQEQLNATFGSTRRLSHKEFLALPTEQKQLLMRVRHHHYFDYFDRLVADNPTVHATGDISPYYAQLNANSLSYIRRNLRQRGFKVKLIFLLRDPVDRIQSQLKLRRRDRNEPALNSQLELNNLLNLHYQSTRCEKHGRYERTLEAVKEAFPTQDTFYGFYEDLFNSKTHDCLEKFLGLNLPTPDFSEKINSAPGSNSLNEELLAKIAYHYRATYEACRQKFGEKIDQLWPSSRFAPRG